MNARLYLITGLAAWSLCATALGDIPNPNRRQQNRDITDNRVVAPVVIKHGPIRGEGRSVQAKIVIPRAYLPGDAGGAVGAPAPTAPAPAAPAAPAPRIKLIPPKPEARSTTPPFGTVIAGIAMSLAAVSVVFVARGKRVTKTAALATLSASLVVTGFGIAQADVAGQKRPIPPGSVEPLNEIVVELSDFGESVTLLLAR